MIFIRIIFITPVFREKCDWVFLKKGVFEKEFTLAGGMAKHSGVYYATLHNVTVGDNCYIENVKNYIANYEIGHDTFIENVEGMIPLSRM